MQKKKRRSAPTDEATLGQLKRSYDVGVSEALRGKLEEQNPAAEASAQLSSSMQPIHSRINKRRKLMRVLRDLQKADASVCR